MQMAVLVILEMDCGENKMLSDLRAGRTVERWTLRLNLIVEPHPPRIMSPKTSFTVLEPIIEKPNCKSSDSAFTTHFGC